MLRALPFTTFGEIAALGLEVHVSCSGCQALRRIDPTAAIVRERCFAGARFRCSHTRWDDVPCGTPGLVKVRPPVLLPVGGAVTLAFLQCGHCLW